MNVRVQYMAQLRDAVGRAAEELEIPEGTSLGQLLAHLATRHGSGATPHLITPNGEPQQSLLAVLNNTAVSPATAAATFLRPGDVVTLLPPIAGG